MCTQQTGLKKLCIAGGVGLNSVANSRILRETPVRRAVYSARGGRRRWRARSGALGLQHVAGQAAELLHGPCLLGAPEFR